MIWIRSKTAVQNDTHCSAVVSILLNTWKSSSTNFGHKTNDPKYFHIFSPDLQAILAYISASVGATADGELYVSADGTWAAGTDAYLVISYYKTTSDGLTALCEMYSTE
jgi:hypothetical protein